jgi:hypothetical protein
MAAKIPRDSGDRIRVDDRGQVDARVPFLQKVVYVAHRPHDLARLPANRPSPPIHKHIIRKKLSIHQASTARLT